MPGPRDQLLMWTSRSIHDHSPTCRRLGQWIVASLEAVIAGGRYHQTAALRFKVTMTIR